MGSELHVASNMQKHMICKANIILSKYSIYYLHSIQYEIESIKKYWILLPILATFLNVSGTADDC